MDERQSPNSWIQTYSGNKFWPLEPRSEDVHITDIAHPLSLTCRYSGHCETFYSVAQHCIELTEYGQDHGLAPEICFTLLLHDASEAYICDIPRPVKQMMPEYKLIERRLEECIFQAFKLPYPMPAIIGKLDLAMLCTEAKVLMKKPPEPWGAMNEDPLPITITPMSSAEAEAKFLKLYTRYTTLLK